MMIWQRLMLAAVGAITLSMAMACEQSSPFRDGDSITERKKRYWDNETVRGTSESRKQMRDMGFGFPGGNSGPSAQ